MPRKGRDDMPKSTELLIRGFVLLAAAGILALFKR